MIRMLVTHGTGAADQVLARRDVDFIPVREPLGARDRTTGVRAPILKDLVRHAQSAHAKHKGEKP